MTEMFSLSSVFLGNTLFAYLQALGIFLVAFLVFGLIQYVVIKRLEHLAKKSETDIDDTAIEIAKSLKPGFYAYIAIFLGYQWLSFPSIVDTIAGGLLVLFIAYQAVIALQILTDFVVGRFKKGEEEATQAAYDFLASIAKVFFWGFALLFVLGNFGIDITAFIAGIGIGGVAIAFALQKILGDLFSSFTIYFDKPFMVGDFIQVGSYVGTVEKIGIKTTRLRAIGGEQLIFSNQELTSDRIQNFGRMEERRVTYTFGVTYDTDPDTLERIPKMVEDALDQIELARFDRAHFKSLGDSALIFEAVFFVTTDDYAVSMDIQQHINLALMRAFKKEGIEFAFPTQTVYVKND